MRALSEFCKAKTPDGLSYSCKSCRSKENAELAHARYKRWKLKDPVKSLLVGVKGNAKKRGIEFALHSGDVVIPDNCPILGIPLFFSQSRTDNTPSIDRIDNTKGYIKNNIVVCSWRANLLKKDATVDELFKLANFYKRINK